MKVLILSPNMPTQYYCHAVVRLPYHEDDGSVRGPDDKRSPIYYPAEDAADADRTLNAVILDTGMTHVEPGDYHTFRVAIRHAPTTSLNVDIGFAGNGLTSEIAAYGQYQDWLYEIASDYATTINTGRGISYRNPHTL